MKFGLFKLLLLTVVLFSACIFIFDSEKSFAESPNILITEVYLGDSGVTTQEYIVLYNQSNDDVEITDWCLEFASVSTVSTYREIKCLTPPVNNLEYYARSNSHILFASQEFSLNNPLALYDFSYSNNSNIPGTNGSIRLVNQEKEVVDSIGWGSGLSEGVAMSQLENGEVYKRVTNVDLIYVDSDINATDFLIADFTGLLNSGGVYEVEIEIDECLNIDGLQSVIPAGYLKDENGNCELDFCPNLEGLQLEAPAGFEKPIGEINCEEIPLEDRTIFITEILPNPPSYDTDAEFIELYNPNNEQINLAGYKIQVGPSYSKEFVFESGYLLANEYLVFNDGMTGITLPNATGVELRLVSPAGSVVSETDVYTNAGDDVSWALVDDQWIYTNRPTPKGANLPFLVAAIDEEIGVTTLLAPCPVGKFRNPETNRCKTLETAVSELQPCAEDEYRNPETNRCRSGASTSSNLVPCKSNQERNPETNRCRNIVLASTLAACPEGQERNPETNRCRKTSVLGVSTDNLPTVTDVAVASTAGSLNWPVIALALLGTFGYMFYEWRSEIVHLYSRTRGKLVQ